MKKLFLLSIIFLILPSLIFAEEKLEFKGGQLFTPEMVESIKDLVDGVPIQEQEFRKIRDKVYDNLIVMEDDDGDTNVQVEESADDDIIRFDTGGTEQMVIDSTGIDFKDHQGLNFIIENRTDDTGMTVTGQIWFRTDL